MSSSPAASPTSPNALRLWPGVLLVTLQWILRFAIVPFVPGFTGPAIIGSLLIGLLIFGWWLFLSRAPHKERWTAFGILVASMVLTYFVADKSISSSMTGVGVVIYSIPLLNLVLVLWAVKGRSAAGRRSLGPLVVGSLLVTAGLSLLRTDGLRGEDGSDLGWRWEKSSEELLLEQGEEALVSLPELPAEEAVSDPWPGFRGPERDSILRGTQLQPDWSSAPPTELWRRAVGPAWSSFAVRGDLFFTQEQRGDEELVTCYRVSTGEPVWRHRDSIRFWESNAGAGPRATPTLHGQKLLTLGATGQLNALNVADGTAIWQADAAADAEAQVPEWGFSSSPLVVRDLVVVAMPGKLMAYGIEDGKLRWSTAPGGQSYGSAQLMTVEGVEQIVLLREPGAISVSPEDGSVLWEFPLSGVPCVQPALCPDGDLLLGGGSGKGIHRVSVKRTESGWTAEEVWHSRRLKPYFNDYAIHEDHVYGFDNSILACIDLETGNRQWKGGRYGFGQFLLLADQDLIVVLTETGELALVEAKPEEFNELARIPAIEGKTWNLPVIVEDVLLVRNDKEMAAFRLPTVGE